MEPRRPRWRFRISALMLLIIIAALAFERWHREREFLRAAFELQVELEGARLEAATADARAKRLAVVSFYFLTSGLRRMS
jgi:Tfp pilus assembly protein FimT